MNSTPPQPNQSFLERWSSLYAVPRSEIIAARLVLGVMLIVGIGVSFTDLGLRVGLSVWLGLATYVLVLIFLLRSVVKVQHRASAWPFWPYLCAAALAGVVGTLIARGSSIRPLIASAIASGLVYGGSHWLLVRFLQRGDRA